MDFNGFLAMVRRFDGSDEQRIRGQRPRLQPKGNQSAYL